MPTTPRPTHPRRRAVIRKAVAALLGAAALVGAFAGTASAKGGGEVPGPVAVCNPVSSMGYKGDTSTADSNTATIMVSYAVKPCDKRAVRVATSLYLTASPTTVAYSDSNAVLSGKFTATGVRANTSYTAKVTVYDAATGAEVGSKTIFAAAIYQGV